MKTKHRVIICANGLVNATIVQWLQGRCGMSKLKRKIKTAERKKSAIENKQTEKVEYLEEISTETWHKMNMWYLAVERNVHTSHSW